MPDDDIVCWSCGKKVGYRNDPDAHGITIVCPRCNNRILILPVVESEAQGNVPYDIVCMKCHHEWRGQGRRCPKCRSMTGRKVSPLQAPADGLT